MRHAFPDLAGPAAPAGTGNPVDLPEHVRRNRAYWDDRAPGYAAAARVCLGAGRAVWGIFQVIESELHVLPDDLAGLDTIELGCGTAYVSAWLVRRGARPVGIDNSPEQLATARRLQAEHGIDFPLHLGNAEATPFPDGELRPRHQRVRRRHLVRPAPLDPRGRAPPPPRRPARSSSATRTLIMLCVPDEDGPPAGDRLMRPQAGMHRFAWPDTPGIEFHLSPGEWIRLLRGARLRDRGSRRGLRARRRRHALPVS